MYVDDTKLKNSVEMILQTNDRLVKLRQDALYGTNKKLPIEDEGYKNCSTEIAKCIALVNTILTENIKVKNSLSRAIADLEFVENINKGIIVAKVERDIGLKERTKELREAMSTGTIAAKAGREIGLNEKTVRKTKEAMSTGDIAAKAGREIGLNEKTVRETKEAIIIGTIVAKAGRNIGLNEKTVRETKEAMSIGVIAAKAGIETGINGKVNSGSMKLKGNDEYKKIKEFEKMKEIDINIKKLTNQFLAVSKILCGEGAAFSEKEEQKIIRAIQGINDTGILDGLDKKISNRIIAQIIKAYVDGELINLDEITKEELENFINNRLDIKVNLQLAEVIEALDSLIKSEVITKKQIEKIMDENVNIHSSDEEFSEAYKRMGGTEDISKVKFFYDKENKIIHIRKDAAAKEISDAIIYESGEMIITDPKTGKSTYYKDVIDISEATKEEVSEVKERES